MSRLALVVVALVAVDCKTSNPQSCALPANHGSPDCVDAGGGARCTTRAECAGTPGQPICDLAMNRCVQCLVRDDCGGTTPLCTNQVCTGCAVHADCDSSACLPDGSCVPAAQVAYVDPAGSDNPDCTVATPCTRVMKALATQRPYLKFHGTTDEAVSISQNVTLLADPGAKLTRTSDGTVLQIGGNSTVEIDDLEITGSSGDNTTGIATSGGVQLVLERATVSGHQGNGISCNAKALTLHASKVINNQNIGVFSMSGAVTISASTIASNQGGGIFATGANSSFDIVNTYIYRNGDSNASVGGAALSPIIGSSNRFEFNTVVDNQIKQSSITSAGVQCDIVGFSAPNNLIARNAVNGSTTQPNANTIGLCDYPTSTVSPSVTDLKFAAAEGEPYNYHLTAGSSAIDQAKTPSTITVDADGNPRPQGPASDQGADELPP